MVDRHDGRHVGRRAVNRLIADVGAPVAVCGYAHQGQGKDDIGGTIVVNPGPLADGCYAIIDPLGGTVQFGVLPRPRRRVLDRSFPIPYLSGSNVALMRWPYTGLARRRRVQKSTIRDAWRPSTDGRPRAWRREGAEWAPCCGFG